MVTAACLLVGGAVATNGPPIRAQERVDWDVVARIREEGFQRSQVMNLAWYMTDVLGPRVTASPSMRKAQRWAKAKMDSIGLTTSVEPFGDHAVSWDNESTSLHLREPDYQPLIGYPFAFTPGTEGKVVARASIAVISTAKGFEQYRGKLRGMVVLASPPSALAPRFAPDATRFATDSLVALSRATLSSQHGVSGVPYEWDPAIHWFKPVGSRSPFDFDLPPAAVQRFFMAEGAAALVYAVAGGDGTVKVDQPPDGRFQRSYESGPADDRAGA